MTTQIFAQRKQKHKSIQRLIHECLWQLYLLLEPPKFPSTDEVTHELWYGIEQ